MGRSRSFAAHTLQRDYLWIQPLSNCHTPEKTTWETCHTIPMGVLHPQPYAYFCAPACTLQEDKSPAPAIHADGMIQERNASIHSLQSGTNRTGRFSPCTFKQLLVESWVNPHLWSETRSGLFRSLRLRCCFRFFLPAVGFIDVQISFAQANSQSCFW